MRFTSEMHRRRGPGPKQAAFRTGDPGLELALSLVATRTAHLAVTGSPGRADGGCRRAVRSSMTALRQGLTMHLYQSIAERVDEARHRHLLAGAGVGSGSG